MLASENRLKGEENFEKVKNEGELFQSDNFAVAFSKRDDNQKSRFGFIVSKKISKLSTLRNRIERALAEAIRHRLNEIKEGYDVVFLAKKNIARRTTDEIMKEVEIFLRSSPITK